MLDKLNNTTLKNDDFTDAELLVFSKARTAGTNLRRSFENWVLVGHAVVLARQHAASAGHTKAQRAKAKAILSDQSLAWVGAGGTRLIQIMGRPTEIEAWRSTLTDVERARWSSPQSVYNKCLRSIPMVRQSGHQKSRRSRCWCQS